MHKKIQFYALLFFIGSSVLACKKGPGSGGRASIKGKVFAVNYNSSLSFPYDSGYCGGQKVYLIYGDETAVGENQDSNHEGAFEFKYLREGKYKVYVYTKTITNHLDSALVQNVEITGSSQTAIVSDFKIKTNKN